MVLKKQGKWTQATGSTTISPYYTYPNEGTVEFSYTETATITSSSAAQSKRSYIAIEKPQRAMRVMGLHAHLGQGWMSDDFDEELPESFWLGDE